MSIFKKEIVYGPALNVLSFDSAFAVQGFPNGARPKWRLCPTENEWYVYFYVIIMVSYDTIITASYFQYICKW